MAGTGTGTDTDTDPVETAWRIHAALTDWTGKVAWVKYQRVRQSLTLAVMGAGSMAAARLLG